MLPPLPRVPQNNYGPRLIACFAILIAVPIFFSVYDAIAHRDQPHVPMLGFARSPTAPAEATTQRSDFPDVAVTKAGGPIPTELSSRPKRIEPSSKGPVAAKKIK